MPGQDVIIDALQLNALIMDAQHLREHHLWLGLKVLGGTLSDLERPLRRRLVELAQAGALTEAALFLAEQPPFGMSLVSIRQGDGGWICRIRCEFARGRSFVGQHADLAAALMIACLQASRRSMGTRYIKALPETKEKTL